MEGADLLLQQDIFLLRMFLPLLCDLQRLYQLRILHIYVLQLRVGLSLLCKLWTTTTKGTPVTKDFNFKGFVCVNEDPPAL